MVVLFTLDETLTSCPDNFPHGTMSYPSTSIIFGVHAVASLAISAFTLIKYNSVKVWDKSFSPLYISNTLWVIYYISIFVRSSCNTIRYALPPKMQGDVAEHALFLTSLILQGISTFALSLTINHQRRYRSTAPEPSKTTPGPGTERERVPLVNAPVEQRWFKAISLLEILFAVLFLIYLVFLYLALSKHDSIYQTLFLVAFIIQRVPITFIMIAIVARTGTEGPTLKSKIVFSVAAVLHLVNDLPAFMWIQVLPAGCKIFTIASALDGVILLNFVALILFFLFIRWEFLRNMDEVIWDNINQIQTTFDFRRF